MEPEIITDDSIKVTRMIIGNEHGRIAEIDLTKPCEKGEDCFTINYQKDGVIEIL